jgi:putrescine---pyruvate transaminase
VGSGYTALWHGQAQMAEVVDARIVIAEGEGAYVTTEDGRELLDLPASLWCCNVGHGRTEIAEAVAAQIGRIEAYSNFQRFATRPALELAERIAALSPVPDGRVLFGSGGSDAVDAAGKLARRYWSVVGHPDKQMLITRTRCYHGLHGVGTSVAGLDFNREGFGELIPATARVAWNSAEELEELIEAVGSSRVAAFYCEPVIGTGGVLVPEPDYLRRVREICDRYDVLLVFDEVISGFGRLGAPFAATRFGVTPDIQLFAKGVTSGYQPLGGLIASGRVAAPFFERDDLIFRHGLTYQAHAAACAAAHANLDILEREQLIERVRDLEGQLAESLRRLESHPSVAEVRAGVGLLGAVRLHDAATARATIDGLLEAGILTRAIGDGDTLQVSPPFVITAAEIAGAVDAIEAALDTVLEAAAA